MWIAIVIISSLLKVIVFPAWSVVKGDYTFIDLMESIRTNYSVIKSGDILITTNRMVCLARPDIRCERLKLEEKLTEHIRKYCRKGNLRVYTDVGGKSKDIDHEYEIIQGFDYKYTHPTSTALARIICEPVQAHEHLNE
jgi:hypothetical protein